MVKIRPKEAATSTRGCHWGASPILEWSTRHPARWDPPDIFVGFCFMITKIGVNQLSHHKSHRNPIFGWILMFSQLLIGKSPFPSISPILFRFWSLWFFVRSWPPYVQTHRKGMRRLTFHSLGWISEPQESGQIATETEWGFDTLCERWSMFTPLYTFGQPLRISDVSKWKKNTPRTSAECISTINELMRTKLLNVHLLRQIFGA